MEKSDLQKALESAQDDALYDFEIFAYFGRGMYGKKCLAIRTDDVFGIAANVGVYYRSFDLDWVNLEEPAQDSIGKSTVYYWPSIPYVENQQDDHSTED